ncbi:NPCBM/NEW2 domain-containing protein [Robiginitalea sp. IMCC43444]|uniref:NPCBM/NEW2 domain-containing protein n=1 Tax=Robiginitalea sp. IMCC43444 TaxID=3459121 RepID=UPI004042EFED
MKHFLFYGLLLFLGYSCSAQEKEVWLDELDLSSMSSGWGKPNKGKSVLGYPIQMGNKRYARGVGVHAESKYMLTLNGQATEFSAIVGVDDTGKPVSSVRFYLIGDQKILWQSDLLGKGEYREVRIDLKGIEVFAMYVSDGGDGYNRDYANYAMAKFKTRGEIKVFLPEKPICNSGTQTELKTPRINGPEVVGFRPGSPVLYRIPTSGERPIKFKVKKLPPGLQINREKGILYGAILKRGVYRLELTANNKWGTASRTIEFKVGDQIALTPPMGWNSWNVWGEHIDQSKIQNAANALIKSGLADYGWNHVLIDDGWQGDRANLRKALSANSKFPDMKELVSNIHEMGLKFGLYSTPWITSFAGYCGGSSADPDGNWEREVHGNRSYTKMGTYTFEKQDVSQFTDWGIDYLKYDWNPIDSLALIRMGQEIKAASRDIVLSISNSGNLEDAELYRKWSNLWRTTSDIRDIWDNGHANGRNAQGIMDIFRYHPKWSQFNGPGNWNDPDMLVLGKVGWGSPRPNRLNCHELRTHFSLWAIWSAPMILGCDLQDLDSDLKSILMNPEVIQINQDRLGKQGELIFDQEGISVIKKELSDGSTAVAVLNRGKYADQVVDRFDWGPQPERTFTLSFELLDLKGSLIIRDLWKQVNIGKQKHGITLRIPHHGVSLLKFTKTE